MTPRPMHALLIATIRNLAVASSALALVQAFTGDVEAARPSAPRSIALACQGGGGQFSFDVYGGETAGAGSIGITCHGGTFDGLYCETSGFTNETACSTLRKPS